jgi:glucose dehydrogenase
MQAGERANGHSFRTIKLTSLVVLIVLGQGWAIARAGFDIWNGDPWSLIPAAGIALSLYYVVRYGLKALVVLAKHEEILMKAAGMMKNALTFLVLHNGRNARVAAALETFKMPPEEFEKRVRSGAIRF